ncbi:ketopantoate reductase family protein [Prolixibacter denitrificans]|uniref:2-dehydropantoate 2-reductase n=1 Tax=Prolixibacter denitrificans TaxID=1541063 RepID=A0A2P8CFF3_9BACT|nr:2-dehydropantoate 2-reductase [Prolixibacter denitrificans]PSK83705.1 2-dehydropantoate 2-reductase [Prolixibacter denitrificans]GET23249.1 2-dehydropantoate 2-reductase [Prolixibacter denitrificans]
MKIAVIGAGGVGGYFGGRLAQAGNEVTFLVRGAHLEAMRTVGLTVKSVLGDFHLDNVQATDDIETIGKVDLIIIGLKAWQVKDMAVQLDGLIGEQTVILPLQNGLLTYDELREAIGAEPVICGLCKIISKVEAPGVINHFAHTPEIIFGEADNTKSKRVQQLKEVMQKAGIQATVAENIQMELWKKFIFICVSGLMAITNTNYGELRSIPETRKLMVDLLNEIVTLAREAGIPFGEDFVKKNVGFIDSLAPDSTTSLARDIWAGNPSELEYQNGTVVKLASQFNVDVPVNQFVYSCLVPAELKARKE